MKSQLKDIKPNATYGEIRKNPDEPLEWEKHRGPEYWEYRRKWEEYPKRLETPEFPLCLDIETTNVCNLDCIMCPRTIHIARGEYGPIGLMDFEFYRSLIDQGAEYDLPAVKLQYLGEPLIHPDLPKQIRYAKQAGVIDVMFNTNAMLLTEEKSYEVLEAGIDNIFFSVDSIYPERYNAIRIGADYNQVVENIIRFVEIKNKGGYKHVQTRVSMVVMNNEVEELVKFKDLWLQYVDVVGFGLFNDTDGIESPYNPNFVCSQPFQRMFVMWDGVCTPCCNDDNRCYVTGNARGTPLKEIWDGPAYQRMRDAQIRGRYKDIDICSRCYLPNTELDGTVIAFEDVETEVKETAEKQRTRYYNNDNLELPLRGVRRKSRLQI